ncbi:VOC family protein [Nocardiopsis coralliicola]
MREQARYPAGVPCWVDRTGEGIGAFYAEAFGWELADGPAGAPGRIARRTSGGGDVAGIGLPGLSDGTDRWTSYIRVDRADAAADLVSEHGGTVLAAPADVPGVARAALCADPEGAVFGLWQAAGMGGAHEVNAPGTWSFSSLTTPDTDAAAAFYAAVFGWEVQPAGPGGVPTRLVLLAGYGDFLERHVDPQIRARQAAGGVPPRFEDAVAWIEQGAGPARWEMSFAAADADAVAVRAEVAGGSTVEPIVDEGWMKHGVLRDPGGIPFAVGEFRHPPQG